VRPGKKRAVETAEAAELRATLIGVELPADKARLLEYAVRQHVEPLLLDALRSLSDREFESLDEVVDELLHVQPD
jgi:GTP-sensing pleiotropic transcriptional regulator CodY